jgi:hypothetical protein
MKNVLEMTWNMTGKYILAEGPYNVGFTLT